MKKLRIFTYAATAFIALAAISCANKEKFDEVTELSLVRCLTPMNLEAKVNANLGDVVTFSWDVAKDAQSYVLSVYTDAALSDVFFSETLEPSQVPYTVKLDADATYYFTVVAKNANKDDSKVADYGKAIKTYAVKDNLYMKLVGRSSTSVSLAWSKDVPDFEEVDRLVYRLPGDEDTEGTHVLTDDEIANATVTVEDLIPGMEYEFILYFKSATRGQVNAWTAVSTEGMTEVSSLDGLLNGIKTQGAKLYLKLAGSPYDIEALDITNGFSLVGEVDTDGNRPVLTGELHIADAWAGENLYFENITFDGSPTATSPSGFGFALQNKNGGSVKGKNIGDISYVNCVITNYTKGLIYEWGNDMALGDVAYDSCEITNLNEDGTQGGDVFDIRQATTIKSLSFVNNTIVQGMRTFVRLDAGTLGALKFENNTLYNLCFVDNTNNAGIFGLQIVPSSFSFKKNLFLGMTGKSTLESANAKYKTADDMSVAASDNYFWGLPVGDDGAVSFFTANFTAAQAGATILEDSPCYNAAGGYFNILVTSDIAGKGIGASKWWTPFVEEPEDLTMTLVPVPHTWNLGNAKYFSGSIKKEMVRDYLFVSGSESLPIVADGGMLKFQSPVVVNRQGVPQHNFVAFHTDKPGSLVIKADSPADYTGHLVVGVGNLEGTSIALKGGASALAEQGNATKILITSITEESIVYVYPSGPVSLAQLAWSDDLTPVNTALPTPEPKADPASITAGDATDIVITWEPVENAASYSVVFNGKSNAVKENEFVIGSTTTGMLDAGSYKVEVYANPAADDIYNTESAAGVATFAVLPKGGGDETELVVKNVEELNAAIAAGKDAITLAAGLYDLGGALTVTAPLALKGQEGAVVMGGFKLSGEVGTFSTENLTVQANGLDIFLSLDAEAGVVASEVKIVNTVIDGFTKSVIYASNTADKFAIDDIVFSGVEVYNQGTGQGMFDLRNGKYQVFVLENSTLTKGRDFLRIDGSCQLNTVLVKNNTMYNLNTSKNGNGIFYVRADVSLYRVEKNLLLGMTSGTVIGKTGAKVPVMSGNYYFDCNDDVFFTGIMDKETALGGQGVMLTVDPVKDAAAGNFNLVNGVVMSAGVGAPKWNPATVPATSGDFFKVTSADEFHAAIDAGKSDILFAAGEYDLSTADIILTAGMHLQGEAGAAIKVSQFALAEGALGNILIEDLAITVTGGNLVSVANASVVNSLAVRNCAITGVAKSVFYGNAEASEFGSVTFSNNVITGLGGGQGTFDIRKGAYTALTIDNNTIVGGRDFIRADASRVTGFVKIVNNVFDGVTLNNGNGVLYVRSTPNSYVVKNNLFLNENGSNNKLSKDAGITVPTEMASNYFFNCTAEAWWSGLINQEVATANGGVILTSDPVKDAASGDYTLVDALCLASNVGPARWNPNAGHVSPEITVTSAEQLLKAIDAGKTSIILKGGTYDLSGIEGGVLALTAPVSMIGMGGVEIIGSIKLGVGTTSFEARGIKFNGNEKALGNALEIAEATQLEKVQIVGCEFVAYNKSLFYGNGADSQVGSFDFQKNLVHGFGTGQGMIDIRKGVYTTINISKNSFYNGGRDFIRCDKDIAGSIAIVNNTFAGCSLDAGNGLLWVRSCADAPEKYNVRKNLFLNMKGEGGKTVLAKTGATVPTMDQNYFCNLDEGFFGGAISQEVATAGGAVLEADPCAGSAEFNLVLTNDDLRKADIGDPRWNSASINYTKKK
ncbi:MAG: DUF4957 domain-containing protein [Candidatus Cryptobacteroides sp.]|nr:DUF4957 domain-containing protein [Candidatus Cryptobacteroides sp.]